MNQKYKLLKNNNQIIVHPVTGKEVRVYRVYALVDFDTVYGTVKANTTGGFIQSESNLPQTDASWVFHQGCVFDDAILIDSAVTGTAQVFGNAILRETLITDQARIFGTTNLDDCEIKDKCSIRDECKLTKVFMQGSAIAEGNCKIQNTTLETGCKVSDSAVVINSKLKFAVQIAGNAYLENCNFDGVFTVKTGKHINETRAEYPDISIHNSPDISR